MLPFWMFVYVLKYETHKTRPEYFHCKPHPQVHLVYLSQK